jgi:predicted transposase YbfD/YdcC
VVVVTRERATLDDVMVSSETSYYVTSLSAPRAGPPQLAAHTRGHWGIENRVHWVRDVTFDEDRHQMRAGTSAARVLATMRNTAISVLRLAGATNIAATMRWVARDPARAAALIGA